LQADLKVDDDACASARQSTARIFLADSAEHCSTLIDAFKADLLARSLHTFWDYFNNQWVDRDSYGCIYRWAPYTYIGDDRNRTNNPIERKWRTSFPDDDGSDSDPPQAIWARPRDRTTPFERGS
jgi:hypothetical protein